ncbi:MAG: hypothetical protein KKH61_19810 [Gammaproteobacteria bacterium]|nr:hypothetical protein [Gammaproteobacteria bacterium]
MAGEFRPIVAFGKSAAKTSTSSVGNAVTVIPINNGDTSYEAGDHVFISQSDDTEYQYLGVVTEAAADHVHVSLATNSDKGSSAKVWQPTTYVAFSVGPQSVMRRVRDTGTETLVSRGGQVYGIQARDAVERLEWGWSVGDAGDFGDFKDFISTSRDEGLSLFTLAYYDPQDAVGKCWIVRWGGGDLFGELSRANPNVVRHDQVFFVTDADGYQET